MVVNLKDDWFWGVLCRLLLEMTILVDDGVDQIRSAVGKISAPEIHSSWGSATYP
jgi:hypothetical protein